MKPTVIGICGKSAAGKDLTATRLVEEYKKIGIPAKKVISYTTRPPREGEVDGVDYHFVDLETFIEMQYDNKFIEHTEFRGWRYGTAINSFDDNCINICVLNPVGMTKLERLCPWILQCECFYLKVPLLVRFKRSIKREHTFNGNSLDEHLQTGKISAESMMITLDMVRMSMCFTIEVVAQILYPVL